MKHASPFPPLPTLNRELARARAPRALNDAEADERLHAAQHEAAHLLASLACGAYVVNIVLRRPNTPRAIAEIFPVPLIEEHFPFITLCGVAWEQLHGDPRNAAQDLEDARTMAHRHSLNLEGTLDFSIAFVQGMAQPLRLAAAGILGQAAKANGTLEGKKLDNLCEQLAPHVPDVRLDIARAGGYKDSTLGRSTVPYARAPLPLLAQRAA